MFTIQFGDYVFPNQTFIVSAMGLSSGIKESTIPRSHGSVILNPYLKSRTIRIKGIVHASTEDGALSQLLYLQENLISMGEQDLYLRPDRSIKARMSGFDIEPARGSDRSVMECDLSMKCASPFFISAGASYSAGFTVSGTTYSFEVYSGGNVFSEPKIMIFPIGGTITDAIKLTNITDGSAFLRYRGTLPDGATLEIDSSGMTVLNNGVDGISYFEGNFLNLVAGTNSFQFVGSNCRVTVEHKYRWYN